MTGFPTVYGRNLVAELKNFVHRPYLVVTMEELWPQFEAAFDSHLAGVHFVKSMDVVALERALGTLPDCGCIIGLGGGQAVDTAKYFAWSRRLPLFQVPTSMSVNAVFGHRAGVREAGLVRYMGWAVPEAVYVDFDVIASAPPLITRSGVCEILCYHTAHADWKFADERGKCEAKWPYDEALVREARTVLDTVLDHLDDIRDLNETGIRTLMEANRWAAPPSTMPGGTRVTSKASTISSSMRWSI